jgi:hypothetical protein
VGGAFASGFVPVKWFVPSFQDVVDIEALMKAFFQQIVGTGALQLRDATG